MELKYISCLVNGKETETYKAYLIVQENVWNIALHGQHTNTTFAITVERWNYLANILFFSYEARRFKATILSHQKTGTYEILFFKESAKSASSTFIIRRQALPKPHYPSLENTHGPATFKQVLLSPLSGKIIKCFVTPGKRIYPSEPLLIIESMKMENEIRAESEALIKTISIQEGDVVHTNQILMKFEEGPPFRNEEVE